MSEEIEFYTPWRLTKPYKSGAHWVIWDDNSNPMAYSDDGLFLEEAVRRINVHEELLDALERIMYCLNNRMEVGPSTRLLADAAIAKARGEA